MSTVKTKQTTTKAKTTTTAKKVFLPAKVESKDEKPREPHKATTTANERKAPFEDVEEYFGNEGSHLIKHWLGIVEAKIKQLNKEIDQSYLDRKAAVKKATEEGNEASAELRWRRNGLIRFKKKLKEFPANSSYQM